MTLNRRITVYALAATAVIALYLILITGLNTIVANATATGEFASSSGDYIFYIIENNEVPLAAVPAKNASVYILWITLASFAVMIIFMYLAWYLSTRRTVRELTGRLTPAERRACMVSNDFLHPVKLFRLEKEAEDMVISGSYRFY